MIIHYKTVKLNIQNTKLTNDISCQIVNKVSQTRVAKKCVLFCFRLYYLKIVVV